MTKIIPFRRLVLEDHARVAQGPSNTWSTADDGSCWECGARTGELHTVGCEGERCPSCMGQLISCRCRRSDSGPGSRADAVSHLRAALGNLKEAYDALYFDGGPGVVDDTGARDAASGEAYDRVCDLRGDVQEAIDVLEGKRPPEIPF